MPRGRPRLEVDLDEITELASEGCTQQEIADILGFSRKTFYARKGIMEAYKKGISEMKISLRHWQMKVAKDGNVQMLIWLGRQYLGQKEIPEESVETEDTDAYFKAAGIDENIEN